MTADFAVRGPPGASGGSDVDPPNHEEVPRSAHFQGVPKGPQHHLGGNNISGFAAPI